MRRRTFLKASAAGIGVALCRASSIRALAAEGPDKTLILGGTAFACGAAHAYPGNVVVVERGIHLVPEFALTNHSFAGGDPKTETGRDICQKLEHCGILHKGALRPSVLPDFFADHMSGRGCSLLLNAETVSCEKTRDGFRVTLCGIDGLSAFTVARVFDTTAEGWQEAGRDRVASKSFSATLRCLTGEPPAPFSGDGVSLGGGAFAGEAVLRVTLPASATWHDARLKLHAAWDSLKPRYSDLALAAEAPAIACSYRDEPIRRQRDDGILWIPSGQYRDVITAFEEGMACSLA